MFKDYEKYLSTSLKVYLFVLVIIFIMKMVGLDYFGIDLNNSILLQINNFVLKWKLNYVYYFVSLYIQFYFYLCITCQKRNLYFYTLIGTIINMTSQLVIYKISNNPNLIYYPINFSIMIIIPMIIIWSRPLAANAPRYLLTAALPAPISTENAVWAVAYIARQEEAEILPKARHYL